MTTTASVLCINPVYEEVKREEQVFEQFNSDLYFDAIDQ